MLKNKTKKGIVQMTIFNNLKCTATDAATKAAKKTDELTNIAKLKMKIKVNDVKLEEVYKEIGRLFYTAERTGEDHTSEIASNIMKADKIKAEIESYSKELAALRNVTVCSNCGNEIKVEFAFCSYCGAKIEKPAPAAEENSEASGCDCGCEEETTDECTCGCENTCECSTTEEPSEEDKAE